MGESIVGVGFDDVQMDEWQRGWHSSDKQICPGCVGEGYLNATVADAAVGALTCSFCGAAPAAEFDVFMEGFMVGVRNLFEQADDAGMPWDGGYVFTTYDHYDLVDHFGDVAAGHNDVGVIEEVRQCLAEKTYASRWWLELEPDEAYSSAWNEFRQQILHRTRFVFWAGREDADGREGAGEISVAKALDAIGKLLGKFDLITVLPAGTSTYRARGHAEKGASQDWNAADLGTNKSELSTSVSRMSPAGIPMFYAADDIGTALAEVTHADSREFFTVGQFDTTRPITVVNLTDVPAVPSIFDPDLGHWQGQLRFLNDLVEQLRQPVDTARSQLDYVPTQVFCEYMLRVFSPHDIHGITWISAAGATQGRCLALDIPQEDCVDIADPAVSRPQLKLVTNSKTIHRRRIDEFRQV